MEIAKQEELRHKAEQERELQRERDRRQQEIVKDAEHQRITEVQRLRGLLLQREETLRGLSPKEFEDEIARMFHNLGYMVTQTPYSNDKGKDAILYRDGKLCLVECKRYAADRSVGRPALQKFFAAMVEEKADAGFFATTGYYTKTAVDYAKSTNITLIDSTALVKLMREAYGESAPELTLKCSECGEELPFLITDQVREKRCSHGHTVTCDITEKGIIGTEGYCRQCSAPLDLQRNQCSRYPVCTWRPGRF